MSYLVNKYDFWISFFWNLWYFVISGHVKMWILINDESRSSKSVIRNVVLSSGVYTNLSTICILGKTMGVACLDWSMEAVSGFNSPLLLLQKVTFVINQLFDLYLCWHFVHVSIHVEWNIDRKGWLWWDMLPQSCMWCAPILMPSDRCPQIW